METSSINDYLARRKKSANDNIHIDFTKTSLYHFVVSQYDSHSEVFDKSFLKDVLSTNLKVIHKDEYHKIGNLILEKYTDLLQHKDDLAAFAILAKKKCYNILTSYQTWEEDEKARAKTQQELELFYSQFINQNINILNISIKYQVKSIEIPNIKADKLVIDTPFLTKMMLELFAKKYYTDIKGYEDEIWEYLAKNKKKKQNKKGRPLDIENKLLKSIIHLFWEFSSSSEEISKLSDYRKYGLIGQVFSIVGYSEYKEIPEEGSNEEPTTYKNVDDYYYRRLSKIWKHKGT